MEMGTKYDSVRSCPPYVSAIMQRYRITYDQSRPNSREGGGYPNGSEGIRKTWWRSEIDRELERSRNLAGWKKQKREEKEKRRRRKGKIEEGRSFTALSHLPSLWSFFSFEKIFSQANLFPMVSVARENTRRYLVSCTPSLDEIGFRWPPTFSAIPSWSARPSIALHFFENVFPHLSSLPFFLFFEAFSSKRGGTFLRIVLLLFPFSFSRHLTLSRHLHEVVLRRREVNKGEAREGGGWRVLPGL